MPLRIRRLAGALLPAREDPDLRRRLTRAAEEIESWKRRAEQRLVTIDRLKKQLVRSKEHLHDVQAQARLRKRRELSTAVLEQILPIRAAERPQLASDAAAAADRERRLVDASDEYRTTLTEDAERIATLQRVDVLGIPWWLPADEAKAGRLSKLQRQGFPLRAVLQTREVALGGVMLDLGANVGRTSITRVLLGDVRAVYGAEPEPTNYACLVQNVLEHQLRGYVLPDRVAIGAERGEVKLRRSAYIGGHSVLNPGRRQRRVMETVTVQLWPLDDWMVRIGVEPEAVSFVKVDTQGSEVNVLRGARRLLTRRHVAWQVEVDPGLLSRAGTSTAELLALLADHFTHFIDLGTAAGGSRARSTRDLATALAYVAGEQPKTDLLLYNAAS